MCLPQLIKYSSRGHARNGYAYSAKKKSSFCVRCGLTVNVSFLGILTKTKRKVLLGRKASGPPIKILNLTFSEFHMTNQLLTGFYAGFLD